jgi:hypothetical protein
MFLGAIGARKIGAAEEKKERCKEGRITYWNWMVHFGGGNKDEQTEGKCQNNKLKFYAIQLQFPCPLCLPPPSASKLFKKKRLMRGRRRKDESISANSVVLYDWQLLWPYKSVAICLRDANLAMAWPGLD